MDGKFVNVQQNWTGDFRSPTVFNQYYILPETEIPQSIPVMKTRYEFLKTFQKEWVFVHPSEVQRIKNGGVGE
jgi:hypothetical protein